MGDRGVFLSAVFQGGGYDVTLSHRGITEADLSWTAELAAFCCYWHLVPYNRSLKDAVTGTGEAQVWGY